MKKGFKILILIAVGYFSYTLITLGLYVGVLQFLPGNMSADEGLCSTLGCCVLLFVYGFWFRKVKSRSEKADMGIKHLFFLGVIAMGMCGISGLWMLAVEKILTKVPFIASSYQTFQEAFSDANSGKAIFAFMSIVILGPIVEELLFRGIFYEYFARLSKTPLVPIVGTAILFGIWHGIFVQGVYTALCGIVMAVVFYQTKNIACTMVIHMVNNFLSYISEIPGLASTNQVLEIIEYVLIIPLVALLFINARKRILF